MKNLDIDFRIVDERDVPSWSHGNTEYTVKMIEILNKHSNCVMQIRPPNDMKVGNLVIRLKNMKKNHCHNIKRVAKRGNLVYVWIN